MSIFGLMRIAVKAFSRHRLRAILTMLGIMIGVGAFVTMVAIGRGASAQVNARIAAMGANVLIAFGGSSFGGGARGGMGSTNSLNDQDVEAIRKDCDAVKWVAGSVESRAQVLWGGSNWSSSVTGTTPDFFQIRDWKIDKGAFFGQRDVDAASKVCVIGAVIVDQLFGGDDPVGQTIRLGAQSCQVIGVLARKGQGGMGQDYDDVVMMPISTVRRKLFSATGRSGGGGGGNSNPLASSSSSSSSSGAGASNANYVSRIYISAVSANATMRAQTQILELLRQRHHTREGEPDDPMVRDMTEFAQVAQETSRTMTLLLAGIAAVSLVVGGIGIMNIMLVSVTERTREIGIRMAVGAKGHYILLQFLFEAMVLTIAGGLVGMGLGTGAAKLFADTMQWPTELGMESYMIGFSFSTLVGVVFGFYPAWRASRLDPIEALRYE
jgi:putative ABC transport system permease protein